MLKKITRSGSMGAEPANRSGTGPDPDSEPAGTRPKKTALRRELRHFRNNRELFLLSLPGILYKLIFAYIPLVGLIIAFKHYRYDLGIFGSEWVGLENFRYLFSTDTAWRITRNTVLYNAAYIAVTTAAALLLAILMNELRAKWSKFYQTALFLPHFLSWVLVGYVAYAFLNHSDGFINRTLQMFGMDPISWYQTAEAWPAILILVHLWKAVGFNTLIYFAGIIGINSEYYEAARIDGATKWQMAMRITVPLLAPLVIILLILSIGNMFRGDFGLHYFIPNNSGFLYGSTDIIDTYVYRALREIGNVSMSAATGFYQSVVGFVLVLAANGIVRKINPEHSLW
ncbi:ABC transporter permease subunit [Paenibacillus sp. FSL H8-0457]|uniref:ABC transporter permease n=1 Tax=Paenibacillus TaxID=44249 RepID=UPI0003E1E227|nr:MULTISPECIES: ABC transporter permease subunit [Paenibacillus]ETT62283.1 binding-protein-dependent transport systems inner membrane component [Paenibacillus sp. FSL H8-457]MCM3257544.1 ABC transporter permease subunit [Paenibacillus lautus]